MLEDFGCPGTTGKDTYFSSARHPNPGPATSAVVGASVALAEVPGRGLVELSLFQAAVGHPAWLC